MLYLDLFRALNEHQVRHLLVGGLAMNLHDVPRISPGIWAAFRDPLPPSKT